MLATSGEVLYSLPEGFADSDEFLSGEAFKVWDHGGHVLVRVADQAGLGDRDEQLQFSAYAPGTDMEDPRPGTTALKFGQF